MYSNTAYYYMRQTAGNISGSQGSQCLYLLKVPRLDRYQKYTTIWLSAFHTMGKYESTWQNNVMVPAPTLPPLLKETWEAVVLFLIRNEDPVQAPWVYKPQPSCALYPTLAHKLERYTIRARSKNTDFPRLLWNKNPWTNTSILSPAKCRFWLITSRSRTGLRHLWEVRRRTHVWSSALRSEARPKETAAAPWWQGRFLTSYKVTHAGKIRKRRYQCHFGGLPPRPPGAATSLPSSPSLPYPALHFP